MSNRFEMTQTPLEGVYIIKKQPIEDERGFFSRFFCTEEFRQVGLTKPIVQINHSLTRKKGAVRGLHFQYPPHGETKIVNCPRGKVYDVAVDFRKDSPTFLQWHAEILSAENQTCLYIPEGFAHGFQALDEDSELLYLVTAPFTGASEGALNVTDPCLNIRWPLPISELSDRDRSNPLIQDGEMGLVL